MRRFALTLFLLVPVLASGCLAPPAALMDTPEPEATATGAPSTATPAWVLPETDFKLQEVDGKLLLVGTLVNTTGRSITGIMLKATLTDAAGLLVAEDSLEPVPSSLAAGETAGYATLFTGVDDPVSATVSVDQFIEGQADNVKAAIEVLDVRHGRDGGMYIVGEVFNLSLSYARLDNLLLLPRALEEGPAVAALIPGNRGLAPRTSSVFLAALEGDVPPGGWQMLVEAKPSGIPDSPNLVLSGQVEVHRTGQGRRYHVIQLQNNGSLARWIGGQLVLYEGEELLSISDLHSPLPLQPGETRVISVKEYPGMPAGIDLSALDSSSAEVQIDALRSRPALETLVDLKSEVSQFETIGELIFIRGLVTNENLARVMSPTILVVSRDQTGRVLDSAWVTPADSLPVGGSVSFELTLLIPSGFSAEMSEYDILAQGMLAHDE